MPANRYRLCRSFTYFAILCAPAIAAQAQVNIDAGSLLRQTERDLVAPLPTPSGQPPAIGPTRATNPNEASVRVHGFKLIGNTLLSTEQLRIDLAPFTDRVMTLSQLKQAADAVTTSYREAGWAVRAFLPQQEIKDGIVTIQVVEAIFGGVSLHGEEPRRVEATRLLRMAQDQLDTGKPLNTHRLDRVLLLLDDLPGVSITGHLMQGQREGETDLVLMAADDKLLSGNGSVDNQGSLRTGADRLSVNLSVNSPTGMGDALLINGMKAQGMNYQRWAYTLPAGTDGWRWGVHQSNLTYRVISDEFASLNPYGTATTMGLDLSYPLLRSLMQNINLALSYDDKWFDNTSNSVTSSYGIKAYNATLGWQQMDGWHGGGTSNASLGLTNGQKTNEAAFTKINISLGRVQNISTNLTLHASASAQVSTANLDSSEKFYLGGASNVRAYPTGEAGGSMGHSLSAELRQRFDNNLTLAVFYDQGRVRANVNNNINPPANPAAWHLQGAGLSLGWQNKNGVDIKASLAQRIGSNPAAQANGSDNDGTLRRMRAWLAASVTF
jgi:hemolysin activation/secretion protein